MRNKKNNIWFFIFSASAAVDWNVKQLAAASNSQIQLMWQRRKILSDIRLFWKVTLPLIPFFTQPSFLTLFALFIFQEEAAIFIEKYCTVNPEKSKIETC